MSLLCIKSLNKSIQTTLMECVLQIFVNFPGTLFPQNMDFQLFFKPKNIGPREQTFNFFLLNQYPLNHYPTKNPKSGLVFSKRRSFQSRRTQPKRQRQVDTCRCLCVFCSKKTWMHSSFLHLICTHSMFLKKASISSTIPLYGRCSRNEVTC